MVLITTDRTCRTSTDFASSDASSYGGGTLQLYAIYQEIRHVKPSFILSLEQKQDSIAVTGSFPLE